MSTKNNPGQFDCYSKAAPDEPMFVLLARDPLASDLVRWWATRRIEIEEDQEKIRAAFACADDMEKWRLTNPPEKKPCIERVDFECDLDSIINEAIHNGVALDDIKYVLQRAIDNFDHNWSAVTNAPEKNP